MFVRDVALMIVAGEFVSGPISGESEFLGLIVPVINPTFHKPPDDRRHAFTKLLETDSPPRKSGAGISRKWNS